MFDKQKAVTVAVNAEIVFYNLAQAREFGQAVDALIRANTTHGVAPAGRPTGKVLLTRDGSRENELYKDAHPSQVTFGRQEMDSRINTILQQAELYYGHPITDVSLDGVRQLTNSHWNINYKALFANIATLLHEKYGIKLQGLEKTVANELSETIGKVLAAEALGRKLPAPKKDA